MAGARRAGYAIKPGATLPWLTVHGHLSTGLDAIPASVVNTLRRIFLALGGDEDALRAKRRGPLRPDAFLGGQILELDEIQHFSSARLRSLDAYPADAALGFDLDEYRALCRRWAPHGGDRYRAAKQTIDFPAPGGRTAQRAYFDALRDLLAPYAGTDPVIRIPAPECDPHLALDRLRDHTAAR